MNACPLIITVALRSRLSLRIGRRRAFRRPWGLDVVVGVTGCMSAAPAKPTGRLVFEALAWARLDPARGPDTRPFPRRHRCRPDCWSCSRSTPPACAGRADRSEAIMTSTRPPTLMRAHDERRGTPWRVQDLHHQRDRGGGGQDQVSRGGRLGEAAI